MDQLTQEKWDKASKGFDRFGRGPERRWAPYKRDFFSAMQGRVLFLAVGTGLDIGFFPPGQTITGIDISPKMLEQAEERAAAYDGEMTLKVMDVHEMEFEDASFDQVFTSCTFCSVPDPVNGLKSLRRVLKPGGELQMFEHTGSRWFPFNMMMHVMTPLTRKLGPEMNRNTIQNVQLAGYKIRRVRNLYLDIVKTIVAVNP